MVYLDKNNIFHVRIKDNHVKYHLIRYLLNDEELILKRIYGAVNLEDMLTKVMVM